MECNDCGRGDGYVQMTETGYFCTNCGNHMKKPVKMEWISVKDKKPTKEDSPILAMSDCCFNCDGYLRVAALHWLTDEDAWNNAGWYDHSNEYGMKEDEIKWWMPLPKAPKEE